MGKGEQLSQVAGRLSIVYVLIVAGILVAYGVRLREDVVQTAVNGIFTAQLAVVAVVGLLYDNKETKQGGKLSGNEQGE